MKKLYFTYNFLFAIIILLFPTLAILYIAMELWYSVFAGITIYSIDDTLITVIMASACTLSSYFVGFPFWVLVRFTIYLDKEKIYVYSDAYRKGEKIQYYTSCLYKDVESVEIVWMKHRWKIKNASHSRYSIRSNSAKYSYLRIKTKNDEQKFFFIYLMSNRTVKKLIGELKHRIEACGNMTVIEDVDSICKSLKRLK